MLFYTFHTSHACKMEAILDLLNWRSGLSLLTAGNMSQDRSDEASVQKDSDTELSFSIKKILGEAPLKRENRPRSPKSSLSQDPFSPSSDNPYSPIIKHVPFSPVGCVPYLTNSESTGVIRVPTHRPHPVVPLWPNYSIPWVDIRRDRFGGKLHVSYDFYL